MMENHLPLELVAFSLSVDELIMSSIHCTTSGGKVRPEDIQASCRLSYHSGLQDDYLLKDANNQAESKVSPDFSTWIWKIRRVQIFPRGIER